MKAPLKDIVLKAIPARMELDVRFLFNALNSTLRNDLRIAASSARSRGRAIDIGANYGLFSYYFSWVFDRVEAFEPNPTCWQPIYQSWRSNIHLNKVALSDVSRRDALRVPIIEGGAVTGLGHLGAMEGEKYMEVPVELRTLDSFGFDNIDLIKIDVEGHEYEVLQGGRETIQREKPSLFIEIEKRHSLSHSIEEIFETVLAFGYDGFFVQHGALRPLREFSVSEHQGDLWRTSPKDYVNNFVFVSAR